MRHVVAKAGEARTMLEAGEDQFVDDDRSKAGQRDLKRLVMEQRDPEQRQREQDEVDGYSEHQHIFRGTRPLHRGRPGAPKPQAQRLPAAT